MNETTESSVRHILVAIDTSPHGTAALEAAARLATELRIELHGLFIEDINLLRLAGLPFAREIDSSSGTSRRLDTQAMERALRTKAESVRRAIAETARRASLSWSFQITRGGLVQAMLTESRQADLLLIGREKATPISARATDQRGPIMLIDEGTRGSQRVRDTAQRFARNHADTIVTLATRAGGRIAGQRFAVLPSCYVQRCAGTVEALLQAAQQWRPQLLLIERSSPLVTEATINALVSQLPCPLALVQ